MAGESCVGQTVTNEELANPPYDPSKYELMSGTPTTPLAFQAVAPEDGLQILDGILGIHDFTTETPSTIYEVASDLVSVLLDIDQTIFGITVVATTQTFMVT